MEALRQYIGSVVCLSLISGILLSLVGEEHAKTMLKILCGAVLSLTVVAPLTGLSLDDLPAEIFPDRLDGDRYTDEGEELARESLAQLIKQEAVAYILDKATSLHAGVGVEIELSSEMPPVPVSAVLSGRVSPAVKARLEALLEENLGIPKENVRWTG